MATCLPDDNRNSFTTFFLAEEKEKRPIVVIVVDDGTWNVFLRLRHRIPRLKDPIYSGGSRGVVIINICHL